MKKALLLFIVVLLFAVKLEAQIFVAPDGSDTNPGTKEQPYLSITKAVSSAAKGDTIFVRGGTYSLNTTISISSSSSGDENNRYYLFAYPGERPVLDFSSMAVSSSNRGINFKASWWHVKGIDIKGAGDNGMNLSGSNNIIEFCSFYENRDTGLQLSSGAADNQVINCDSYYNADPTIENADGFAAKLNVGTGNYFFGCRAWQNLDDGWDGYLRESDDITTTLENCWSFKNGYLKNGSISGGDGNGFKMGGSDDKTRMHNFILKHCLAFDNYVKGFDQNNNRGSMTLLNCTAYHNGTNYSVASPVNEGKVITLENCVVLGYQGSISPSAVQEKNSWDGSFNVTADDFVSTDPAEAYGPRKEDGSLPDISFMHLAGNSDLIDAGVDVGLPYNGLAPDLGAFEFTGTVNVVNNQQQIPDNFNLAQNYPNPFNPATTISFSIPKTSNVIIKVYSLLGKEVATLMDRELIAGTYKVTFNGENLSSGIYFYTISADNKTIAKKMTLLK